MDIEITFDLNESKEIDINPNRSKRVRKTDDYDYEDPFIDHFEGEDDAVEIEPKIQNFFMYEGMLAEKPAKIITQHKKPTEKSTKKREDHSKPIDTIYCLQNSILDNILEDKYNDLDIVCLMTYDLMISHDLRFVELKKSVKNEKICQMMTPEFIISNSVKLEHANNVFLEELKVLAQEDKIYNDANMIFSNELCEKIYYYIDVKNKLDCYYCEIVNKKRFSYNSARKHNYIEIYPFFREASNKKQLGYHVYQYAKKAGIGRFNGYKPMYLVCDKEVASQFTKTFDSFQSDAKNEETQSKSASIPENTNKASVDTEKAESRDKEEESTDNIASLKISMETTEPAGMSDTLDICSIEKSNDRSRGSLNDTGSSLFPKSLN